MYLRVCNHILVSYYSRGANNNALSTIGLVVLHKPNIYSLHSMLHSKKTIVEELQSTGNASARSHEPAGLWDITFCTR